MSDSQMSDQELEDRQLQDLFLKHQDDLKGSLELNQLIQIYEKMAKELISAKDAFIVTIEKEEKLCKVPTLDIEIPIKDDIEGILLECYHTREPHTIINARRSFLYRKKIDNFIDAKIKDIMVVPILDNHHEVIAIIWVATLHGSDKIFTTKDIALLDKLSIVIKTKIISSMKSKLSGQDHPKEIKALNILIADDSVTILRYLEAILSKYNTNIITARSKEATIELFRQKTIDVVFINESLSGKSGSQTIKTIRATEKEKNFDTIPIFAITSDKDHDLKKELIKSGANLILYQPIEVKSIIRSIQRYKTLNPK